MHRLIDGLAKERLLYPPPLITAPSVLVIDIPPANRGSTLPLGRYYPIVLETEQEIDEMEHFLARLRGKPVAPDLFDLRPSQTRSDYVLIARYDPPVRGWPCLLVCRWPDDRITTDRLSTASFARGCYTVELFSRETDLDVSMLAIITSLSSHHRSKLQLIAGDAIPSMGTA